MTLNPHTLTYTKARYQSARDASGMDAERFDREVRARVAHRWGVGPGTPLQYAWGAGQVERAARGLPTWASEQARTQEGIDAWWAREMGAALTRPEVEAVLEGEEEPEPEREEGAA